MTDMLRMLAALSMRARICLKDQHRDLHLDDDVDDDRLEGKPLHTSSTVKLHFDKVISVSKALDTSHRAPLNRAFRAI
jgi:hypothetical protein